MTATKQKSLAVAQVAAYVKTVTHSDSLWSAIIVFFGALFLLAAIPFYPSFLVPILAAVCGLIAFKKPPAGTMLGVLLLFPAVSYQSPIFGWLFILIIAGVIFEVVERWKEISLLEILILAPFAFGANPIFGWVTIFGMAVCAYHFGSKKSIAISICSVFFILLLSATWVEPNGAFMPLKLSQYTAYAPVQLTKNAVLMTEVIPKAGASVISLANLKHMSEIGPGIGTTIRNISTIFLGDSGLIQVVAWVLILYGISYISGIIKKRKQMISSLVLILVIPIYYGISILFEGTFHIELIYAVGSSIVLMAILEQFGVVVTQEEMLRKSEKAMAFGKHGMSDVGTGSDISLKDIGGYEDVKQELKDSIVLPLEKKGIADAYGLKPPSGILLFGPPGTGKTMLMRAMAKEMKYSFINVKSSEILSQWYGESEKNLAEVFEKARKNSPTILFFDEIDALAKKRTDFNTDDVGPRVLSTFLTEMDGAIKNNKTVLVIGATNVPQKLDAAMLRPGRFDKIVYMHLPDPDARESIFRVYLNPKKVPVETDIDYKKLAKKTNRFSGADIANVVREAVKIAAKEANAIGSIVPISDSHITRVLASVKPSTSIASLDEYEQFRLDFERRVEGKEETKPREKTVTWQDVAGLKNVKKALLETIELPLLHEEMMKDYGVKPSKGILLFGPPGTGKTLIVKAACNELKASFQSLSGAEIMKKGYTKAVEVVRETFNRARENTPAILFVDEIETFAPARGEAGGSEIIGQFLTEMDGLKELKNVVVIAATNRPAILDPAILRPGRFDKIFYIPPPDGQTREELFRIHLGKFAANVNLKSVALITPGFTGADIASICQEAKMTALRKKLSGNEIAINDKMLVGIIKKRRPSVTKQLLMEYEDFLKIYGERGGSGDEDNESEDEEKEKKKSKNRHSGMYR